MSCLILNNVLGSVDKLTLVQKRATGCIVCYSTIGSEVGSLCKVLGQILKVHCIT